MWFEFPAGAFGAYSAFIWKYFQQQDQDAGFPKAQTASSNTTSTQTGEWTQCKEFIARERFCAALSSPLYPDVIYTACAARFGYRTGAQAKKGWLTPLHRKGQKMLIIILSFSPNKLY